MLLKELPWSEAPAQDRRLRELVAALLRAMGALLERVAHRLAQLPEPAKPEPWVLEYYAEAGAPEGALYVNGELVCRLPGVPRL